MEPRKSLMSLSSLGLSPVFWLSVGAGLALFFLYRRKRRGLAWLALLMLPSAALFGSLLCQGFDLGDLAFNLVAPITHELRVYPVQCQGKVVGNSCCAGLGGPLDPTTFMVSKEQQQVLAASADIVVPLSNCYVQDYLNWQCMGYWDERGNETTPGHVATWEARYMNNGEYHESPALGSGSRVRGAGVAPRVTANRVHVSAMEWWNGRQRNWWKEGRGIWSEESRAYHADPASCQGAH
jgi:hypothetical protein